ncbi:MAG: S-methyl-5-thioribose-1-phosphate isomerase [Candidatus Obscuribacterales bacterium]|nr:S-methyl-5-thioribose-1-phosphate isomerase [Candidatus Obscuribacterales bacterium]
MVGSNNAITDIGIGTMPVLIDESGRILLIDQRHLPDKFEYFDATSFDDMVHAIKVMVVRGAPSIGVAAGFSLAWESEIVARMSPSTFLTALKERGDRLKETRPTAVNLAWAVDLIINRAETMISAEGIGDLLQVVNRLKQEAHKIMDHHVEVNKRLSDFGAQLVSENAKILTHCNAGSLATCGWGTALGVVRSAHIKGLQPEVFVDETRPRHQGARLTMWELKQDNIPSTLVCDSMAGHLMAQGHVDLVVTGADRIAANGDTANKIGTYNLAVLASYHKIPFYIAAPLSTVDGALESGSGIPIEYRDQSEVLMMSDRFITVDGARAYNPAFDVTPANLITAIITEAGILRPDYNASIKDALATAFC